ncbi:DUF4260 domain-containing protein [Nitratireductor sp.]|uniref:DUF4260 domain-containing protein n=1 Tax=Nitratireductor sp. TaxID=1872084 RepID=UPI00261F809F|nr:DUF4260 domain-containing protein [Nitratireductor sp.]MCV0379630.1 DUF4260 domain-containing protein [Nitratireductor sp.]
MKRLLRLEGASLAVLALILYQLSGGNWWLFAMLLFAPDLTMLGYLAGPRVGAWCYNLVHAWPAPVFVYLVGLVLDAPLATHLALILAAHIGADRALGYGLKHESGFRDTHLGRIGSD